MVYLAIREKMSSEPNNLIAGVTTYLGIILAMLGILIAMGWWMLRDLPIHSTGNIQLINHEYIHPNINFISQCSQQNSGIQAIC